MKTIAISGNTYPVKEQIKALGGKWDKWAKCWMVPAEKAREAQALVDNAPKSGRVSNIFRFSSGHVAYRNKAGRCEDAPCCGCCTI